MAKTNNNNTIHNKKQIKSSTKPVVTSFKPLSLSNEFKQTTAITLLSTIVASVLIYFLCFLIAKNYTPDTAKIIKDAAQISILGDYGFAPEPVERMQFILSLLSLPIILLLFQNFVLLRIKNIEKYYSIIVFIFFVLALYIIIKIFNEQNIILDKSKNTFAFFHQTIAGKNILFVILTIPISFLLLYISKLKKTTSILFTIFAAILIVTIFLLNIFDVDNYPGAYLNLNPVLYPITQVFQGKTLIVDLTSQYGLYPEFLNVIFKITGLSVKSFSLVFAFLTALSFLFIYLFFYKIFTNKIIALFTFSSLVFLCYFNVRLVDGHDAYLQFWTIRIFFTYLFCLSAYNYSQNNKSIILYLILNSIAFYWNTDTGLVCFGATALHILYLKISEVEFTIKQLISPLLKIVTVFIGFSILFIAYLYLKSGEMPSFEMMFKSQNLFYIAGFFMLPMPIFHFWLLVVLVYILALAYSLLKLIQRKATPKDSIYFALSILGFGALLYYQGRSHDFVLTAVYYPAIFIIGITCDDLLKNFEVKNLINQNFKIYVGLVLLLILSISFYSLFTVKNFVVDNINRLPQSSSFNPTENLRKNIAFIKNNFNKKDSVLILGYNLEGIYYAETDLINPINITSSTEIILKSDGDFLNNFIRNNKTYKIIIDNNAPLAFKINPVLMKNYDVIKTTDNKSLSILAPKKSNTSHNNADYFLLENIDKFQQQQLVYDTITFPKNFNMKVVFYDKGNNTEGSIVCANMAGTKNFSGFTVQKIKGDSLYIFSFGDGTKWLNGVQFYSTLNADNTIDLNYIEGNLQFSINNKLIYSNNTQMVFSNSDTPLVFNYNYNGYTKLFSIKKI